MDLVDQIHCLACDPPGCTSADPLRFGQPGHNVADGVALQDPSSGLADADLVFGLGGHGICAGGLFIQFKKDFVNEKACGGLELAKPAVVTLPSLPK